MNPFIQHHKQTSIFITAGFPELESLEEQLRIIQSNNIDFIEIGIPFSDPLADGPTIQHSSSIALENGMTIKILFEQLKRLKSQINVPIVLMGYLNPVMQFGLDSFLRSCTEVGVKALILPDLSYELYSARYKTVFEKYHIPLSFLVTPQTENDRIQLIAEQCKNSFVYLVSQNSITGGSTDLNQGLRLRYDEIKKLCGNTPLFLGFGIDSNEKRKVGFETCDGVIVGTAYLKNVEKGREEDFLEELLAE